MSATVYPFQTVESKWQQFWATHKSFKTSDDSRPHAYILEMLPYPSGRLHMGHVRNYAIGDAIARFKMAQGFNVLHPMGWDAFGLPAENAAMHHKSHPETWTLQNIHDMRQQLLKLGFSYDWDREIATCLPDYYGQEQKIFLSFYHKGLIYRKESWVNWDPVENSVLANEQVVNGRGWRSGACVEKRKLNQWSVRITAYAQQLLDDLKKIETGWPEKVIKMQENWIGRSEGALVYFDVNGEPAPLEIYTTRPDTLFGASFCAIAPTHPLAEKAAQSDPLLKSFITDCQQIVATEEAISTVEKKGYKLNIEATHPFDATIKLPIYVANFVLMDYGTGALFGCPAHDARDFEFATKYSLPIRPVIETKAPLPYLDEGVVINSSFLDGLTTPIAKKAAIQKLEDLEKGKKQVTFRLRDWSVSRQRYWGCPIPMIHCPTCGEVPVPDDQLPVKLPHDVSFDKPGNPLEHHPTWKHTTCPKCKGTATRETDTLDTFFESSWYFLRYCSAPASQPFDQEVCEKWLPVEWYIGGVEHAVLHLLYARFFTKALRDCGYINIDEPFKNLLTQGMVCHETYKNDTGAWLSPQEVIKQSNGSYIQVETNSPVTVGRSEKMSKSKFNTVDPTHIIETYGADVARLFILSDTPPDRDFDWNTEALEGAWRYLNRVWRLIHEASVSPAGMQETLRKTTHLYVKRITEAYEQQAFNKAIAFIRELTRAIEENYKEQTKETIHEALIYLLKSLSPITPHLSCELLLKLQGNIDISWPVIDESLASVEEVTIAVQVNGKLKGTITIPTSADNAYVEEKAFQLPAVQSLLAGKTPQKTIIVPKRIVNIVALL